MKNKIVLSNNEMRLPVEEVADEIKEALKNGRFALLQAPPGAGKTTLVPLMLLDESWLDGKKILLLEPRRIAARASASRMAQLLCEPTGKRVGYHIRLEKCSGPETRIEVVTEGILTRRIQNDPALEDIGLIIFDEFHERNLNSDLGLALSLEICSVFRKNLKILVMSATLDSSAVAGLMGNAPVICSQGKSWPVETIYHSPSGRNLFRESVEREAASLIRQIMSEKDGDILVFLPGVGEIKRTEAILKEVLADKGVLIIPLYGKLSKKEQDFAILPAPGKKRKIVLATSIAETSITIEGVSIVIDSGLMRAPKYFSGTGMSRLETIFVSRASADQRRGRAGRTMPGTCYRLWSKENQRQLKAFNSPEIMNTDLSGLMLELALWGVSDIYELKFLDYPPDTSVQRAKELLKGTGSIDSRGGITPHGKKIAALGIHPRLGHMILKNLERGRGSLACSIAALLSERDFVSFPGRTADSDIGLRLEIVKEERTGRGFSDKEIKVNIGGLKAVVMAASRLEKAVGVDYDPAQIHQAGSVLAMAYPERIMRLRDGASGKYLMAGGRGAFFLPDDSLSRVDYAVAAELDGNPGNSRVFLAAQYSAQELKEDFYDRLETRVSIKWEKSSSSVAAVRELRYGAIVLEKERLINPDSELVASEMIRGIKAMGSASLPWTKDLRQFQARALFLLRRGGMDLPDISDGSLMENADLWLRPFIYGFSRVSALKKLDLGAALRSLFTWEELKIIEKEAPERIKVPAGSNISLQYPATDEDEKASPVLEVRIQELFGLEKTPSVAKGRIPVIIHLLSPALRPVQITRDLKSFWETTYRDVKKELMGRYPKHYWPDDPLKAMPTNKTKKRI